MCMYVSPQPDWPWAGCLWLPVTYVSTGSPRCQGQYGCSGGGPLRWASEAVKQGCEIPGGKCTWTVSIQLPACCSVSPNIFVQIQGTEVILCRFRRRCNGCKYFLVVNTRTPACKYGCLWVRTSDFAVMESILELHTRVLLFTYSCRWSLLACSGVFIHWFFLLCIWIFYLPAHLALIYVVTAPCIVQDFTDQASLLCPSAHALCYTVKFLPVACDCVSG